MFNQSPFNASAFNADEVGGGVDATAILSGFDVVVETGDLVAFVFVTDRSGFGKQSRVLEPIEHVYPVDAVAYLTPIEVCVEAGSISATGETHIDATAKMEGFAVGVGLGKLTCNCDSVATLTGFDMAVGLGSIKAKGIHNPSDEEIIAIIMEAMVA